jgi:spermidine synthase
VLSHYVAAPALAQVLDDHGLGAINTDDQNLLEFAFARNVGRFQRVDRDIQHLAERLALDRPEIEGEIDEELLVEERLLFALVDGQPLDVGRPRERFDAAILRGLTAFQKNQHRVAATAFEKLARGVRGPHLATLVAESAAILGDPGAPALLEKVVSEGERELLRARWLARTDAPGEAIVSALARGFTAVRTDPWIRPTVLDAALALAVKQGNTTPALALRLAATLKEPFAVEQRRRSRLKARVLLARAAHDAGACVGALDDARPLWWDTALLETEVACLGAAGDPRSEVAARSFALRAPFGAGIGAEPAPPPPLLEVDAGGGDEAAEPTGASSPPDAAELRDGASALPP